MQETTKDRQKMLLASKARNLINEYGPLIEQVVSECMKEFEAPINEETSDRIAMEYKRKQGGKEALQLFMKKLNAKTHE